MDQQQVEKHKGFWQTGGKLVCSILVIFGFCMLVGMAAAVWGLDRRNKAVSAEFTATAIVRATEQAKYKVVERFDTNKNDWRTGAADTEYWSGYITIQDGVYLWNVEDVKDDAVSWADFSKNEYIRDFDVYVDIKTESEALGAACGGLIFRKSPYVSKKGEYYYFALCNNSMVGVSYHSAKDGWETMEYSECRSCSKEWNRLELSARGSHFIFSINGSKIYEMDDERRDVGGLALVVELHAKTSARILFDNFGFNPVKQSETTLWEAQHGPGTASAR